MLLMCLFAMMTAASLSAKAQEITINLLPGWTWISYPKAEVMDLATAFGDFTPVEGDMVKSQFGFAMYENGRWAGSLTQFTPGMGYKYYSNRTEMVSFVFGSTSSHLTVTTAEPLLITTVSAMCGGEVTTNDGTYILMKGLCWAAHENPTTNNDFYQEAGSGVGSFTIPMTDLNIGTTYYVRTYAVTPYGTVYGSQKSFTTRDGIPVVSTDSVTNVLSNGATCFGTVTDGGGLDIVVRGFCWGTEPNPTIEGSHTTVESELGSFSSSLTGLSDNTTYYVRAYATNSYVTMYGNEMSFITPEHAYVDLGLPSGLLWATCNVGAETPEEYGDYFAWGETQPKDTYNWSTYQYCNGSSSTLTKYCNNSSYGYNGFTDNLTILLPEDDAATVNWGGNWRIPTKEEWQELYDNTSQTWTTQNDVFGSLFIASNGDSLFLPAAGNYEESSLTYSDSHGFYWSSSLDTDLSRNAWRFEINSDGSYMRGYYRFYGRSIRAVRSMSQNNSFIINVIANPTAGGMVSGGGYYEEATECTIAATANEGYTFENWTENGEVVSTEATYSFTVAENRSLVANFVASVPIGAIDGKFTINENGDQVYFSQGNLQYQASTSTWRFAENQWNFVGDDERGSVYENGVRCNNALVSSTYSGWIDMFGWGTSGWNSGANCYQPWSINARYIDYYPGGSYINNLTGSYANADWGVYNAISNGGNQAGLWRTLTVDEWAYVFDTRSTSSGIRYAKASVKNVNGVILLPDDWSSSYFSLNNTNTTSAYYASNVITSSQWNTLEQYGAVFLPAAGGRTGTFIANVGDYGYYWSASYCDSVNAHFVWFGSTLLPQGGSYRYTGSSVRLVRSAQ